MHAMNEAPTPRLSRVKEGYTTGARRLADLPAAARSYLDRLQDLSHAPIRYVSVGSRRDQIIDVT